LQARKAGFLVAPHPVLALSVLQQASRLRYLRISVPVRHVEAAWRQVLGALPVVPVHITANAGPVVYALADDQIAARIDDLGFNVDRLGSEDEPLTTDLYLLRDDRREESGFLTPQGNATFLSELPDGAGRILIFSRRGAICRRPRRPYGRELSLPRCKARTQPEAHSVHIALRAHWGDTRGGGRGWLLAIGQ
jgi:bacterial leucyl aminopeptidase